MKARPSPTLCLRLSQDAWGELAYLWQRDGSSCSNLSQCVSVGEAKVKDVISDRNDINPVLSWQPVWSKALFTCALMFPFTDSAGAENSDQELIQCRTCQAAFSAEYVKAWSQQIQLNNIRKTGLNIVIYMKLLVASDRITVLYKPSDILCMTS